MRPLLSALLILPFVLLCGPAAAFDVPARATPPVIDGALNEWGPAVWISIDPAAPGVGQRGDYQGPPGHAADAYMMWDADHLYVAVVIEDDVLDGQVVPPDEQVWERGGQRKDKMFYYDHVKVFVRGPGQMVGYNLWMGPKPYAWGGRQRRPPEAEPPVQLAVGRQQGGYAYEAAIPWSWLEFYPASDIELKALVLVTDADLPEAKLATKIRDDASAWIWWEGGVTLRGKPPGLKAPVVVAVEAATEEVAAPVVEAKVDSAIIRLRERQQALAVAAAESARIAAAAAESARVAAESARVAAAAAAAPATAQTPSTVAAAPAEPSSVIARLNRRRLARAQPRQWPEWVRQANPDPSLSTAQVDSFAAQLTYQLRRIFEDGINSRTDGIIIDMAQSAGTRRDQARGFVRQLAADIGAQVVADSSPVRSQVAAVADQQGIDEGKALRLVGEICRQIDKVFAEGKPTTTRQLLNKSRRGAKLSASEAQALAMALVEAMGKESTTQP